MIYLNGIYFDTVALQSKPAIEMFSSGKRSTTGRLIITQAQVVSNERGYTVNVNLEQRLRLENLLTVFGPMDFIDETGFQWLISDGFDTDNIAYNTGAYFTPHTRLSYTEQIGPDGRACDMNWNVDFTLIINAIGVRDGGSEIQDSEGQPISDDS